MEQLLATTSRVVLLHDRNTLKSADELKKSVKSEHLYQFEHGTVVGVTPSTADVVISYTSNAAVHTMDILATFMSLLKPNGKLVLYEPLQGRRVSTSEELSSRLLLAGFTETRVLSCADMMEIISLKPEWEVGASQRVNIQKQPSNIAAWSSEATEFIDEDSLLREGDKYIKPATTRDDCEVGSKGKNACKNCTCGRAEQNTESSQAKLTLDMLENPGINSSCGSCGLGDAFRCAGCPYRGLPSFVVGEKITIPASFLEDDI